MDVLVRAHNARWWRFDVPLGLDARDRSSKSILSAALSHFHAVGTVSSIMQTALI